VRDRVCDETAAPYLLDLSVSEVRSSVRLLESGTGTLTTELLGLGSSGVSDDQSLVVLKEHFLKLSLGLLVVVLLIVGEEGLGDGLADGEDLVGLTTTLNSHSDVDVFKLVTTDKEDGLEGLNSERLGLNKSEGLSVDSDGASTGGASGNGGRSLLLTESLNLFLVAHCALRRYVLCSRLTLIIINNHTPPYLNTLLIISFPSLSPPSVFISICIY
jgi:hypothetical protein